MPGSAPVVEEVRSARDLDAFIELPYTLYRGDPHFVPPLRYDVRLRLDRRRHPYYRFADAALFLVRRRGEVIGRIGATVNTRHNEYHAERTAFFGFFECVREFEAARALFDAAAAWARARGMNVLRGPASFSLNDECGLLVRGFDGPPTFMMPYNPPWYADLVEGYGFVKAMDLLAWRMAQESADLERFFRVARKVRERDGLETRIFDVKRFDAEIRKLQDLYADAWQSNWGFVPMTDAEFDFMGRQLRPVLVPEYCTFAMKDGREIGFVLALPDFNRVIAKLNGRLFPFGFLRLLASKRRIPFARILTLGVRRETQGRGYDAVLLDAVTTALLKGGISRGEMSWMLETNEVMNNTLRRTGGEAYRVYRLYDAPL
ncbi:MAG TPA: N-acetyltransferase [Planctomycetota bacterium]|nr:N-acetyltransferase [Planctomycetota bacterium]